MAAITEEELIHNLDGITLRNLAANRPQPVETMQQLGFADRALESVVTGWIDHRLHKARMKPLKKPIAPDNTWAQLVVLAAGEPK